MHWDLLVFRVLFYINATDWGRLRNNKTINTITQESRLNGYDYNSSTPGGRAVFYGSACFSMDKTVSESECVNHNLYDSFGKSFEQKQVPALNHWGFFLAYVWLLNGALPVGVQDQDPLSTLLSHSWW